MPPPHSLYLFSPYFSKTSHDNPFLANSSSQDAPACPPPMTVTSYITFVLYNGLIWLWFLIIVQGVATHRLYSTYT